MSDHIHDETIRDETDHDETCHQGDACPEYQELSRRRFFRSAAPAAAAALATYAWVPKITRAASHRGNRDVMVHVFLRGAMDGLTTCVPYADPDLYLARPTLAVQPPGSPDGAIDLDGFFGLAPGCADLKPIYDAGQLVMVHASGSPDPTHSHFDAFRYMEFGIPLQPLTINTGWLARHLMTTNPSGNGLLRAIAGGDSRMPYTLQGGPATVALKEYDALTLPGNLGSRARRRNIIEEMYATAPDPLMAAASDTFATMDLLGDIDFDNYQPEHGANYPGGRFARTMRSTAALIKADVGVEAVMTEIDGWDLHANLGSTSGAMHSLLLNLSSTIQAFWTDLTDRHSNLVVLIMSEFGRRVAENASAGTDHGHGNVMMAIGGGINGGQVYTDWPGLAPGQLNSGDLAITTDYRDIVAEILSKRMDNQQLDAVFPNYTPTFHGIAV